MFEWTKATEATPEPKTYVLVTVFDKEIGVNVSFAAYWDGEQFRSLYDWRPMEGVTRWTPYPRTFRERILKGV